LSFTHDTVDASHSRLCANKVSYTQTSMTRPDR
jgi:hypothetical protein